MISIQYVLPALLLSIRVVRADVADGIVAQTFLSTGATEDDEFVQGLLFLEDIVVPELPIDSNLRLGAEEPASSDDIVIDFSPDVLGPYSEQAAILGEDAIARLSRPRQAGTGEYCARANDCRSRVCILNRCCGSKKTLCRNLNCRAADKLKECYVENNPCDDQRSCTVNPVCEYYDPCMFTKCGRGYTCQLVKSCILPPRAECVLVDNPCDTIDCPPDAVCILQESYPPTPVCHIVQEVVPN